MKNSHYAANAYGQQQVSAAAQSPANVMALAYEKIISSLNIAIRASEEKNFQLKYDASKKANDIITQLIAMIDPEAKDEITQNVEKIYKNALLQLMDFDVKNDPTYARNVIQMLTPLAEAWKEISKQNNNVKAPQDILSQNY